MIIQFGFSSVTITGSGNSQTAVLVLEYLDKADGNNGWPKGTGVSFPIAGNSSGADFIYARRRLGSANIHQGTHTMALELLGGLAGPAAVVDINNHVDWYTGQPDVFGTGSPNDQITIVLAAPHDYSSLNGLSVGDAVDVEMSSNVPLAPVTPSAPPTIPIQVNPNGMDWQVNLNFEGSPTSSDYFKLVLHDGLVPATGQLDDELLSTTFSGNNSSSINTSLDLSTMSQENQGKFQELDKVYVTLYWGADNGLASGETYEIMSLSMPMSGGPQLTGPNYDQFRHYLDVSFSGAFAAADLDSKVDMGEYVRASEGFRQGLFGIDYDIEGYGPPLNYGAERSPGQNWSYIGQGSSVKQALLNIEGALTSQQAGSSLEMNYKDAVANIAAAEQQVLDDYQQSLTSGDGPEPGDSRFVVAENDFYVLIFHDAFQGWTVPGYHRPGGNTSSGAWAAMELGLTGPPQQASADLTGDNDTSIEVVAGNNFPGQQGNQLDVQWTEVNQGMGMVVASFSAPGGQGTLSITYDPDYSTMGDLDGALSTLEGLQPNDITLGALAGDASDYICSQPASGSGCQNSFNFSGGSSTGEIGFVIFADDKEMHADMDAKSLPIEDILEVFVERHDRSQINADAGSGGSDVYYSESKGFSGTRFELAYPHAHKDYHNDALGFRIKAKHDGDHSHGLLNGLTISIIDAVQAFSFTVDDTDDPTALTIQYDSTAAGPRDKIQTLIDAANGLQDQNGRAIFEVDVDDGPGVAASPLHSSLASEYGGGAVVVDSGTNVPTMAVVFQALITEDIRQEGDITSHENTLVSEHGFAENLRDVVMDIVPGQPYELSDTAQSMGLDPTSGEVIQDDYSVVQALQALEHAEENQAASRSTDVRQQYWGSMMLWDVSSQALLRLDTADETMTNVMVKFESVPSVTAVSYVDDTNNSGEHRITIEINNTTSPSSGELANLISNHVDVSALIEANVDGYVGIMDDDDFDTANGTLPTVFTRVLGGENLDLEQLTPNELQYRFGQPVTSGFTSASLKMIHINGVMALIEGPGISGKQKLVEKDVRYGDILVFEHSRA
jgi:hypothetical protein